jgi:hypothetical protein
MSLASNLSALARLLTGNASTGVVTGTAPAANDNSTAIPTTGWLWSNIQALVANCIAAVATAAGFSSSFSPSGYIKFPSWLGSLIIQWGAGTTSTSGSTGSFTLAWPNGCYFVGATTSANNSTFGTVAIGATSLTGWAAWANAGGPAFIWFAAGR